MCLYQFLIAVRSEGAQLTSADGETTRYIFMTKKIHPQILSKNNIVVNSKKLNHIKISVETRNKCYTKQYKLMYGLNCLDGRILRLILR